MENLLLLCVALLSIFIFFFSVKRRDFSRSPQNLIPSPPKLPFIGNIHQLSSLYHQSLYFLSLKYGPLMLLHFGQVPWLVVSSSDMASTVLLTHDRAFASRPSGVAIDILRFSDMAFEPYGENWRQLRKIFTIHLMSTEKVNSYRRIRGEEVDKLIAKIGNHALTSSGNPIELSKLLSSFMIDVICRVVSGKFFMEEGRYAIMHELVKENLRLIGQFSVGDTFPSLKWLEGFVGLSKRARRNRNKWDLFFDELIQVHVQSEESRKEDDNFVDILLSLKNDPNNHCDLTMEQMKGLLVDAFAAGISTTYITIDWAMSELMKNPNLMKKLKDEVSEIVPNNDMVQIEDINQMSYLKAVINETLRLHPVLPLLAPRESLEDCQINGFMIPKGTRVLINAWAIGREAKSWESPEKFMPKRFIGSQVDSKGNDFQFIPFGAGSRICPGISFATVTIELVLANLVHRFDWELPNGMKREEFNMEESPGFVVHRKDELCLVVKKAQTSN